MINQPIHILNQMGVIPSFSVAKRIKESEINRFFKRHQKNGKKRKSEIEKLFKKRIVEDIQRAVMNCEIPGLLSPEELGTEMGLDKNVVANMPELNRLVMIITHKLNETNYDKMSLCYFVNSLVNLCGLTEEDFENFHIQNGDEFDEDGEDDDDGEVSQ